ncbi:MAG: flagellar hook protein FlgE [Alphaproteobacteria bacterium]|nr:flagellar hook protein FlgE [Alphaproteobacteria bacterium]MCK5555243.1 flagellar hook protein FlgE [Alphaproteobacteria bacterium]
MSVFGSLFTAVSGMQAQSDSISMISNNIANVSTVGFKRTDAAFSSLVTSTDRSTSYSSGSARSIQKARIDQQGILQQSSSGTDIAISGNGFFIVKASVTEDLSEPLYTRAGSFSEDSSGVLRNAAGFYLQGWPIDQDGNLPASQADISSLLPVDVAFLGGLTQPTTSSGLSMNLEQGETQSPYPIVSGFSADFARGIKVYDSLGAGHDLTINFKKMETPTAIATGIIDLSNVTGLISDTPPFLATDQFSVTVGAIGPTVITLDGTIADMLEDINAMVDGSLNPVVYAQIDDNGFLSIKATNTGDNLTLTDVTNTPLAIASLGMGASPVIEAAPAAPIMLTPLASTPNTEGWWTIDFRTPTGAIVNAGAINFTGDGKLNAVEDLTNKIPIDLDNIDWGNGSNPQDIAFDISGFTQFSGEYNVISSTQNGAELGLRTGVSIDEDGFVIAQFSNGQSSRIFKLAIATFANANGLNELTGNVFRESDSSGSFNLREAGNGSAGKIASGALESSNVDLADEFSRMIVTQRAYSANTKVISTADQMTQELLQLR